MSKWMIWFFKLTAWLPAWLFTRTKIHYENRAKQNRRLDGPVILVCNHIALYDFVIVLFAFWRRTIRCEMAEVLFGKDRGALPWFVTTMGGIEVDRTGHDFSFMKQAEEVLQKGGVLLVFPESRLPLPEEERPLPFVPSVAVTALTTGVKVVPLYTTGSYFKWKRNHLVIGAPLEPCTWVDENKSQSENIQYVTERLREEIIRLGGLVHE